MYLARISNGRESVERVDDVETDLVNNKVVRRPRQARAWRFDGGAAAFSQSPEGALASARKLLAEETLIIELQQRQIA